MSKNECKKWLGGLGRVLVAISCRAQVALRLKNLSTREPIWPVFTI